VGVAWRGSGAIEPDPAIEAWSRDVVGGLMQENLKLTATERLEKPARMPVLVEDKRAAGRPKGNAAVADLAVILEERRRLDS